MNNSEPTLLIMAAGMGSRYGGLKQIDAVGPNGEIIIEYSMHDAVKAGFKKVVFIIQRFFEDAFKEAIGRKLDGVIQTEYAYQEIDTCLEGREPPADRKKPWGTAHAILAARDVIQGPFAVINADDYYGPESYKKIKEFLCSDKADNEHEYAMVGYLLRNSIPQRGAVNRGICDVDGEGWLREVVEYKEITKEGNDAKCPDERGQQIHLAGDKISSMNIWGFQPSVFGYLGEAFKEFLESSFHDTKAELFLPFVLDENLKSNHIKVRVLKTGDNWFGVTYKEDMLLAREHINALIKQGIYPEKLWKKQK
ncbi:NDP-sugar synthase [Fibrobacterota bacterium]